VIERIVYVLDDDAAVLRSLERLLGSANYRPVTFNHPETFLAAAKTFETGCILLDVHLPGMSGLEVQTRLLKMRSDLAIIVVTGQGRYSNGGACDEGRRNRFYGKAIRRSCFARVDRGGVRQREPSRSRLRCRRRRPAGRNAQSAGAGSYEQAAGRPAKQVDRLRSRDHPRTVEVHRARMMERLGLRQLAEVIRLGVVAMLDANRRAG
jgi:two-component system response regulator FixJ